ncbi:glutamine amidotransferase [Oxalobacter paraformigenes]|uniref:Glutamine amidotransferase domain-containing protein n=1 Tax=Oxalobacter paraformigenes TaxID=556268 RepID=C3X2W1_9BURK|nr:glutamine amidotransferase [Oxalobacter paraformigenes]EEO27547.2 hypothetical protein OFAG_00700 [Oxalobacter paraformigenes]
MAILIVETGETPGKMPEKCGTIAQWFENALDEIGKKAETVRPYRGEALPVATSVAGAIITGSWSMVTDREDWSEKTAEWIRELLFFDIPVFGVCYGHQLMAHALGGLVGDNPEGGEKGAFTVSLTGKAAKNPLFDGFPDRFPAYLFHQQSVLEPPKNCDILGTSEKDACQILRYGPSAFSVQFHPEFTADILKAACLENPGENGFENYPIAENTPWPRRLLHNFCRIVEDIG